MDDQELGMILGRIEAGVEENGRRLDRHNKVHEGLEATVQQNETNIAVIKGKAALIATLISLILGGAGWLIFFWGTGLMTR